jgi:uncharacterized cupin superfamily protein
MRDEAKLEPGRGGLVPATEGWFVVNVGDTAWRSDPYFGSDCRFESESHRFRDVGINISVLQPGQRNCYYHSEQADEHFLVLHGECLLLVEGEQRRLGAWDFVHCAPGTEHVFVGAGDSPCAILMVGDRVEQEKIQFPRSELALRHGAGVDVETNSPDEAYAAFERPEPKHPAGWETLPWA